MATNALPAAITVFVLVVWSATALYCAFFAKARMSDDRLVEPSYRGGDSAAAILGGAPEIDAPGGGWLESMKRHLGKLVHFLPNQRQIAMILRHAGFNGLDKLVFFRLVQCSAVIGGAFVGFGLGALYGRFAPHVGLLFGALGYLIPVRIIRSMARNRQLRSNRELPATLDLLTVCLEAGLPVTEALRLIARRTEHRGGVLGGELSIMNGELSAGLSLSDALSNLADRVGTDELKSVAALLIQSERMGSRLAPALRASADQLATRRRLRAEERAHKAAVKMLVPMVVFILPAMLMVVLGPAFLRIIEVVAS